MRHIVNAVFLGPQGVLLARRSAHRKAYPGLWSFPGGHVEANESLDEALVREAGEELAVVPLTFEPLMRIADPNAASEPVTYHMYLVRDWRGHPQIMDSEHSEIGWFAIADARALSDLALAEYLSLIHI